MLAALGLLETLVILALAIGFFGGAAVVVFARWLRGGEQERRRRK